MYYLYNKIDSEYFIYFNHVIAHELELKRTMHYESDTSFKS